MSERNTKYMPKQVDNGVLFSFYDYPNIDCVALAGTFNHWDPSVDPLVKDEDGIWRITKKLGRERHLYKFVINNHDWIPDPSNPLLAEDCQKNSSLTLNELGEVLIRTTDITRENPGYYYRNYQAVDSAKWIEKAVIYEVNIESFVDNGFKGFINKLDYLKQLGVNTLWIMPIHEVSVDKRLGLLGDPYAVKDYYSIRPTLGSKQDFKEFIDTAHKQGFKIIMDWTLNRVGYSNELVLTHSEWFTRDENNKLIYLIPNRDYFVGINFENQEVKQYIIDALKYWIHEFDIDGYRFDDSDLVPHDFLNQIRRELIGTKKDLMLISQSYDEVHHIESCDLTYEGGMKELIKDITLNKKSSNDFIKYYESMKYSFPRKSLRKRWLEGKEDERLVQYIGRDLIYPAATLLLTMDGVPFILMGQEFGDTHWNTWTSLFEPFKLDFANFDHKLFNHYKKLISIRRKINAFTSGDIQFLESNSEDRIITYIRSSENEKYLVVVNLSGNEVDIDLSHLFFDDTVLDIECIYGVKNETTKIRVIGSGIYKI